MEMIVEVVGEKQNPLLDRKEFTVKVSDYEGTPSRDALCTELAKKLGAAKDCVYVEKLDQGYGTKKSTAFVQVYSSVAAMQKRIHKKNMRQSGKKKAAAPA